MVLDRKLIGENIRTARIKRGLTQQELAQKLNKANTSISNYESGNRPIRLDDLLLLATALNVDVTTFFAGALPGINLIEVINSFSDPFAAAMYSIILRLKELDNDVTALLNERIGVEDDLDGLVLHGIQEVYLRDALEDTGDFLEVAIKRRYRDLHKAARRG